MQRQGADAEARLSVWTSQVKETETTPPASRKACALQLEGSSTLVESELRRRTRMNSTVGRLNFYRVPEGGLNL